MILLVSGNGSVGSRSLPEDTAVLFVSGSGIEGQEIMQEH